jgi:hypothetical protein
MIARVGLAMTPVNEQEVRKLLIQSLHEDVTGPSSLTPAGLPDLEETLTLTGSTPEQYFLTGFLTARSIHGHSDKAAPDPDSSVSNDALVSADKISSQSPFKYPSSMGCTVYPKSDSSKVEVLVEWGTYFNHSEHQWKRTNHSHRRVIELSDIPNDSKKEIEIVPGVKLFLRKGSSDRGILTVRLVNSKITGEKEKRVHFTLFQPKITLTNELEWAEVRKPEDLRQDPIMEILYCDSEILALGHNIGVDWKDTKVIYTTFLPEYEIPIMRPESELSKFIPSLSELSSPNTKIFSNSLVKLEVFSDEYDIWIKKQESILTNRFETGALLPHLHDQANELIASAKVNVNRIREGVQFISTNPLVANAFKQANLAIQYSQNEPQHPDIQSRKAEDGSFIEFKWRPFQLAFILLNLKGLCALEVEDDGRDDRNIVDLAWFPTGGGKTEAYFGLIALLSFYRRSRFPEQEKTPMVHTIMRYTLRLLTSDQADRIVRLLGAMNHIFESQNLTSSFPRFRLGMWVGSAVSPNDLLKNSRRPDHVSAQKSLARLQNGLVEKEGSVLQFDVCPWCGDNSDDGIKSPDNWRIGAFNDRPALIGFCPDENCLFNDEVHGVPFTPIDDDIYLNPPTVLLATVDKIARLAHNPWAKSLDNSEDSDIAKKYNCKTLFAFDGTTRAPDLIIQDELHLLTGPLGTTAGLIESTMDVLWSAMDHKPKYVAATATIRGADRDVRLMFGRSLNVFPPPVAKASDNFFAKEDYENPGRIHIGILGSIGRSRTLMNQPAASLLQRVSELEHKYPQINPDILDPYHTLVGYFNSLRELGGAQASIPGQIASELIPRFAEKSGFPPRELRERKELTSRRSSSELKEVKSAMKRRRDEPHCVDTVVTTNMFQVGIDIPRLGLMAIVGQPKSNSEYIQSSGRVGRIKPGLVISLLRSNYPRDQSHFENFRVFHQELYRSVDRTSTTPFSQRSLDRGSTTALAVLLRMGITELSGRHDLNNLLQSQEIRRRAEVLRDNFTDLIAGRENHASVSTPEPLIRDSVQTFQAVWSKMIALLRRNEQEGHTTSWLLYNSAEIRSGKRAWLSSNRIAGTEDELMNSLRDVALEIRVAEEIAIVNEYNSSTFTIPEGHLFSQASPGSLWEKDGFNYLTLGINRWDNGPENRALQGRPIGQWFSEDSITPLLPPNLRLRFLPTNENHGRVGIARWPYKNGLRCKNGHLVNANRPDADGISSCEICSSETSTTRFISICSNGHLHPFNYYNWVHQGQGNCPGNSQLKLNYGKGASYTLEDWTVECTNCNLKRNMGRVPWINEDTGPKCKGWRPWLGGSEANEECDKRLTHKSIGSIAVSFPEGASIMLIPLTVSWSLAERDSVKQLLLTKKNTPQLFDVILEAMVPQLRSELSGTEYLDEGDAFLLEKFKNDISTYLDIQNMPLSPENIRLRESKGILSSDPRHIYDPSRFNARSIIDSPLPETWSSSEWPIKSVSRIDRLTELKYLTGLTRGGTDGKEQPLHLSSSEDHYGICQMHYGEGLFFELKPEWIEHISESRNRILSVEHAEMVHSSLWLRKSIRQQLPTVEEFSTAKNHITVLHTFSHLLIRELCNLSGYSLGSIRERLYLHHNEDGTITSAGILLFTSGPSSDGTLGGLVRQGTQSLTETLISRALESLNMCSNDPVCFYHIPTASEQNGAACHSCLYLPETSCEFGNLFLDRRWH